MRSHRNISRSLSPRPRVDVAVASLLLLTALQAGQNRALAFDPMLQKVVTDLGKAPKNFVD